MNKHITASELIDMQIGETITVSYEESRKLRKQGWKPRNDIVVMMYVGKPDCVPSNKSAAKSGWTQADHDFANRKMAEEPKPVIIRRKARRRKREAA